MLQKPIERTATLWGLAFALGCWLAMFLAAHDIWHALGKPNIWTVPGPTAFDIRAFFASFYALPVVLMALAVLQVVSRKVNAARPGT